MKLTLKTNISPLSTVTVSKFPSQMSGGWLSGRFGCLGGGEVSFLMGGVTGSGLGWKSVGVGVGKVGGKVGLGSGWAGGSRLPSVVFSGGEVEWEGEVG